MSEFNIFSGLFDEKDPEEAMAGGSGEGGKVSALKSLLENKEKLKEVVQTVAANYAPPGYMSASEAQEYMTRIKALFSGEDEAEVELSLCIWGMMNGTGGTDDYTSKPPIVVGVKSVPATSIFGHIIPTGVQGQVRQFYATRFEAAVPDVLKAMPALHDALAPRVAKAGLTHGQTLLAVDFVKGGKPETVASGVTRSQVKDTLLARRHIPLGVTVQDQRGGVIREHTTDRAAAPAKPDYLF